MSNVPYSALFDILQGKLQCIALCFITQHIFTSLSVVQRADRAGVQREDCSVQNESDFGCTKCELLHPSGFDSMFFLSFFHPGKSTECAFFSPRLLGHSVPCSRAALPSGTYSPSPPTFVIHQLQALSFSPPPTTIISATECTAVVTKSHAAAAVTVMVTP